LPASFEVCTLLPPEAGGLHLRCEPRIARKARKQHRGVSAARTAGFAVFWVRGGLTECAYVHLAGQAELRGAGSRGGDFVAVRGGGEGPWAPTVPEAAGGGA